MAALVIDKFFRERILGYGDVGTRPVVIGWGSSDIVKTVMHARHDAFFDSGHALGSYINIGSQL